MEKNGGMARLPVRSIRKVIMIPMEMELEISRELSLNLII